jgi:flagellar export protein FliJ
MAFRFTLATVLRLREIAEEKEERLLGKITQQIVVIRTNLADIEVRREQVVQERESDLHRNIQAAALQSFYGQLQALDFARQQAEEQLKKFESLRAQQMNVYSLAHRNRQVLADMRIEQREAFDTKRTQEEQKVMDDNFVSRRRR